MTSVIFIISLNSFGLISKLIFVVVSVFDKDIKINSLEIDFNSLIMFVISSCFTSSSIIIPKLIISECSIFFYLKTNNKQKLLIVKLICQQ